MGDLREILGIQAPKVSTGPVVPGSKTRQAQGPPPMEPRAKKPRTQLFSYLPHFCLISVTYCVCYRS